jgi:formate hydrogenlyase subunit 6/NADH:ubiquinone oxidoreductase subunit I
MANANEKQSCVVERDQLQQLIQLLSHSGYRVVGPVLRDGAIVYDDVKSLQDLPAGWTDEQDGGKYRLRRRDDDALFGYAVGPHSWKKFLHPPTTRLWQAARSAEGFTIKPEDEKPQKFAFIGVRSCELHAIAVQDRVFLGDRFSDPVYRARREDLFIVAVNCGQAGGTCFCVSMNTGPRAQSGFDIALTEVIEQDRHYFVAEAGTERGGEFLLKVPNREAQDRERRRVDEICANTARQMGRTMDTTGIKELLYGSYEHPRWDDVASRCLACANCTMACPTCFCTTVEDVTDLTGDHAERWRKWDSCFNGDFSFVHGGSVRPSIKSRYRQWMIHKLATWIDQFGSSGCVGCGRCITWCPVAIDITEEVRGIRATPKAEMDSHGNT